MKLICFRCRRAGKRFSGGKWLCEMHAKLADKIRSLQASK